MLSNSGLHDCVELLIDIDGVLNIVTLVTMAAMALQRSRQQCLFMKTVFWEGGASLIRATSDL